MCRSVYTFCARPSTSLPPDDLDKIRFLIVNHASTTDFRSKLICLSPYLPSNSQFSLCPPDPPGSIEQQRLGTPNVPGNATGTSYMFHNNQLTFRKCQDHRRTFGNALDAPRSNQPKPPSSYVISSTPCGFRLNIALHHLSLSLIVLPQCPALLYLTYKLDS